jgi:hypothetical protein
MTTKLFFPNETNATLHLGEGSGARSITKQQIEVTMFATGAETLDSLEAETLINIQAVK